MKDMTNLWHSSEAAEAPGTNQTRSEQIAGGTGKHKSLAGLEVYGLTCQVLAMMKSQIKS